MEDIFENIMQALDEYGEAVRDLYQKRLLSDDKKSSGKLIDSVKCKIAYKGTEFVVYLELQDYWKYVEEGLKGKKNSKSKYKAPAWRKSYPFILNWIEIKPVLKRPMDNGNLPTDKQLAAMISKSIEKNGIKAGHQLAETVNDINRQYQPILEAALQKDFDLYSIKIFNKVGKMIKI